MEKERNGRIIAVIALLVAVAGLSLGFAAFSSYLKIDTVATVSTGSNWNVGFSTDGLDVENVTTPRTKGANETGNPGIIDVTKYTISQNTNATLSTTTGSSVSYTLSILNKGAMTAYLDSVNFDNVSITCSNDTSGSGIYEGVEGAGASASGNSSTITPADCAKMFGVKLRIGGSGGTEYDSTPLAVTANTITAGNSTPVDLTIYYKDDADARSVAATLDGNIIVTIGSISVVYTSTNPSGS